MQSAVDQRLQARADLEPVTLWRHLRHRRRILLSPYDEARGAPAEANEAALRSKAG